MNRPARALSALLWLGLATCAVADSPPHLRQSLNELRAVADGDSSFDRTAMGENLLAALEHLEIQAALDPIYPQQLRAIHDTQNAVLMWRKGLDASDIQAEAAKAAEDLQGVMRNLGGPPHLVPDVPPNPQTMTQALELVQEAMVTDPPKQTEYIQLAFDLVLLNPDAGNFAGHDGSAAVDLGWIIHPRRGDTVLPAEHLHAAASDLKKAITGAPPDPWSVRGSPYQAPADTAKKSGPSHQPVPLPTGVAPSLVLINGDRTKGIGLLVRMDDVTGLLTDFQLVSDNAHLQMISAAGETIAPGDLKIATDRNLAFFAVSSPVYPYVNITTGAAAQIDEAVTLVDRAQAGDVFSGKDAAILALGIERMEFDSNREPESGGGPVLNADGQVIGLIGGSPPDPPPTSVGPGGFIPGGAQHRVHRYGLRLDNIVAWEACGANEIASEAAFLAGFRDRSRALDALLNSADSDERDADSAAAARIFKQDEAIHTALDNYRRFLVGADPAQRRDGLQELLGDLQTAARADLATIQRTDSFHGYNRLRAAGELAYRKALLKELDDIGNDPGRMSRLPK